MDDLPLKKIRVSTNEMPHEGDGFSLTESFCCSKLVKVLFEVAILAELEDNVKVFPTPEAVVHFAYEGGWNGFERSYFAFDLFFDVVSEFIDVNDFDCALIAVFALPVEDRPTGSLT